jgi:hypothetical protein
MPESDFPQPPVDQPEVSSISSDPSTDITIDDMDSIRQMTAARNNYSADKILPCMSLSDGQFPSSSDEDFRGFETNYKNDAPGEKMGVDPADNQDVADGIIAGLSRGNSESLSRVMMMRPEEIGGILSTVAARLNASGVSSSVTEQTNADGSRRIDLLMSPRGSSEGIQFTYERNANNSTGTTMAPAAVQHRNGLVYQDESRPMPQSLARPTAAIQRALDDSSRH